MIKKGIRQSSPEETKAKKHEYYMKNKEKYKEWNRKSREKRKEEKQKMTENELEMVADVPKIGDTPRLGDFLPNHATDNEKEVEVTNKQALPFCNDSCIHSNVCKYAGKAFDFNNLLLSDDYKFIDAESIRCKFRVSQS